MTELQEPDFEDKEPLITDGDAEPEPDEPFSMLRYLRSRVRILRNRPKTTFCVVLVIAVALFIINYASHGSVNSVATGGSRKLSGVDEEKLGHFRNGPMHYPICRTPKLGIENDANKDAYEELQPLKCDGLELFSISKDGKLVLDKSILDGRTLERCDFQAIEFGTDSYPQRGKSYKRTKEPFDGMYLPHDFIHIECYLAAQKDEAHVGPQRKLRAVDSHVEQVNKSESASDLYPVEPVELKEKHQETILTDGQEVQRHNPRLAGSMGLPDFPDSILHNRARQMNPHQIRKDNEIDPDADETQQGPGTTPHKLYVRDTENNVLKEEEQIEKPVKSDADDAKSVNEDQDYGPDHDPDMDYSDTPGQADFEQFLAQIHPEQSVIQRVQEQTLKTVRQKVDLAGLNVLIFAMDSMSHLSYQRLLPETYKFLAQDLGAIHLHGYNIVGDATTAAIIPILTGKTEEELPEIRVNKPGSTYADIYPFVWNKFEQCGYATLFAEDNPSLGTFQLRFNGFEHPPTDHYMRPFWQAALDSTLHKTSPRYCLGNQPEHRPMLSYLRQFFTNYNQSVPKFAFGFLSELSHHDNSPSQYIDHDLVALLRWMKDSNLLNDTLLIVMGDHGARYSKVRHTVQGKLEERLPMMSLTFPKWFQDKYPDLHRHLRKNARRLTTPFDIHETIKALLNLKESFTPVKPKSRGISLLKPVPLERTCAEAGIALHWCTCLQYEELNVKSQEIQDVAALLVKMINERLREASECHQLKLKEIINARMVLPNEMVLKFEKTIDADQRVANFSRQYKLDVMFHQVIVQTSPGDGMFEATMQYQLSDGSRTLSGDISRINKYGDAPRCVAKTHPDLRKYCHCPGASLHGDKQT